MFDGPWPDRSAIDTALEPFRGTFLQRPPAFSAKKIDGERSYDIARRGRARTEGEAVPAGPAPVEVTTRSVDVLDVDGPIVRLDIHREAGFYVPLAHDLGAHLGMGAHLVELRRTEACGLGLDRSVSLDTLERLAPEDAAARLVSIDQMLPRRLPVVPDRNGRDAHAARTRTGRCGHGQRLCGNRPRPAEGTPTRCGFWTKRATCSQWPARRRCQDFARLGCVDVTC